MDNTYGYLFGVKKRLNERIYTEIILCTKPYDRKVINFTTKSIITNISRSYNWRNSPLGKNTLLCHIFLLL